MEGNIGGYGLEPETEEEYNAAVEALAAKIDVRDAESIRSIGRLQQDSLRQITKDTLESSTMGEIEDISKSVGEIMTALKNTRDKKVQGGLISRMIARVSGKAEEVVHNQMTAKEQIDTFNQALVDQRGKLIESYSRSERIRDSAMSMFTEIRVTLDALQIAKAKAHELVGETSREHKDVLERAKKMDPDNPEKTGLDIRAMELSQEVKQRVRNATAIEKKEVNLRSMSFLLSTAMDNIDMKLGSDEKLIESIEDARAQAIPMIELYLSIMIEAEASSKSAALIGAAKDLTDETARSVADQTHQLVIEAGQQTGRALISHDTIVEMGQKIEQSLLTLQKQVAAESKQLREANLFLQQQDAKMSETRALISEHVSEANASAALPSPKKKANGAAAETPPEPEPEAEPVAAETTTETEEPQPSAATG